LVWLSFHHVAGGDLSGLPGFAGHLGMFHREPIIDVHMFKNFNFAMANVMMFVLGLILFSSLVTIPQFLQTLMGYTAESAGLVLSASGVVILFQMPIVGQLTSKFPVKYIMAFGWLALALGMYIQPDGWIWKSASGRRRNSAWRRLSAWDFCSCRSRWPATSVYRRTRPTAYRAW